MKHISAIDIDRWADRLEARALLPALIRRLVHSTLCPLTRCDFPAGESIQRDGWDGIVDTTQGNSFVPTGVSLWELGCDKNVSGKASQDFAKRSDDALGFQRPTSTFIFLTPRKWIKKKSWCHEAKQRSDWREVRAYDCDDLEQWLERAPGVANWLACLIGSHLQGMVDVEEHWDNLAHLTDPPLHPSVFLASRADSQEDLIQWLAGPPTVREITAPTLDETLDFATAVLVALPEPQRTNTLARSIIVESLEAWDQLSRHKEPLILFLSRHIRLPNERVHAAARKGHHVLLPAPHRAKAAATRTNLPRVYHYHLSVSLQESGVPSPKASQLARASSGSLKALKRLLGGGDQQPPWASSTNRHNLSRMALVGAWHAHNRDDRNVIAELFNDSYESIESVVTLLSTLEESPVFKIADIWTIDSKFDTLRCSEPALTETDLRRYAELAANVLREQDPKFDLPPEERWLWNLKQKHLRHSAMLRRESADTLALLAVNQDLLPHVGTAVVGRIVDDVIERIFSPSLTWQEWASLDNLLPLIAEANPELFLAAIEQDLRAPKSQTVELFHQGRNLGAMGGCHHAGLLWAIEGVAWSRDYLARATHILLRLAELDPGGQYANRPSASLACIFCPWHPQTTASAEERIDLLAMVINEYPIATKQLLFTLSVKYHGTTTPIHQPRYRDWALSWKEGVEFGEHEQQKEVLARMLIQSLNADILMWIEVIKQAQRIPEGVWPDLISGLQGLKELTNNDRQALTTQLRETVTFVESFENNANYQTLIDGLTTALRRLTPTDPMQKHRWLFDRWPSRYEYLEYDNSNDREKAISEDRTVAIKEIIDRIGIDAVTEFAEFVEAPDTVGGTVARAFGAYFDSIVLPSWLVFDSGPVRSVAQGYGWVRHKQDGWNWVDSLSMAMWAPRAAVAMLVSLPFERAAWDRVITLGHDVEEGYWQTTPAPGYELDGEDLRFVINTLLIAKRPIPAIVILSSALHRKVTLDCDIVLNALESLFVSHHALSESLPFNRWYDIAEILKHLQTREDCDLVRLQQSEWFLLPLLDGNAASAVTLCRKIVEEPRFLSTSLPRHTRPLVIRHPVPNLAKQCVQRLKEQAGFYFIGTNQLTSRRSQTLKQWLSINGSTRHGDWRSLPIELQSAIVLLASS